MILHFPPGSPALVRDAAAVVLVAHIGGGGVGLLSGAAALLFRKVGRAHRAAGNLFFVSMLTMSAIGASVAAFLPARISVVAGVLTFYLVATAWVAVRRKAGGVGLFEIGALLVASSAAGADLAFGFQAAGSPGGQLDGFPAAPHFVFAAVAALAAGLDLKVIVGRGVRGARRIARHLWRMCAALFIAASSLFQGQQQLFPESVRGSPILLAPEIAILGLMIFWLLRVRFAKAFQSGASSPAGNMTNHTPARGNA